MQIVDLTEFLSLTALVHLSRYLSVFNIVNTMIKDKRSKLLLFISVVGLGMVWDFFSIEYLFNQNEWILYIASVLITFFAVALTCKGSLFEKIFAVVLGFLTNLISGAIAVPIVSVIGIPYSYFISWEAPAFFVLLYSIIIFSFSFFVAFIIKSIKKHSKKHPHAKTNKSYFLLLIPIINLFYMLSFTSVSQNIIVDNTGDNTFITLQTSLYVFTVICFLMDVALILFVDYLEKMEYRNIENEKKILANTMTYQQTIMLNEEKKELRKIKHDINNLLTTATGFIEIGKPDKALEILNNTSNSVFGANKSFLCSNDIISTILFIKQQDADKRNVQFDIEVSENSTVKISDYDLCRLLHNLIDNSINAAEKSDENRVSIIKIDIENDSISISTQNSYSDSQKTKKHDRNHGYGTTIIMEICKKYNGKYTVDISENNYFTKSVLDNINISNV